MQPHFNINEKKHSYLDFLHMKNYKLFKKYEVHFFGTRLSMWIINFFYTQILFVSLVLLDIWKKIRRLYLKWNMYLHSRNS